MRRPRSEKPHRGGDRRPAPGGPRKDDPRRDQRRAGPRKGEPRPGGPRRADGQRPHGDPRRGPPERRPARPVPGPRRDLEPASLSDVRPGLWLFATREGAERDLVEELALWNPKQEALPLAPGLVLSERAPSRDGRLDSTFGRQVFQIDVVAKGPDDALVEKLASAFAPKLAGARAYALHAWTADSDAGNRDAPHAHELEAALAAELGRRVPDAKRLSAKDLGPEAVPFLQVCLLGAGLAAGGAMSSNRALSLAPGGRLRAHVGGDRPSRAARKLAEAFLWLGLGPEPGDQCVDLGAAPGGWTFLLLERRAKVIAVDPAKLRPDLLTRKGVRYVGMSAFDFEPDEPVDWLFCDMAWRPLEVAKMLARWSRLRNTTMLVANFKLPMKKKAEMVAELRKILEDGGYRSVRTRQLYHDREEITLTARVG